MANVTKLLSQAQQGDKAAAASLLPIVYDELRQIAARKMAHERPDHTLDATCLVHEAYLRLVDEESNGNDPEWDGRAHFFAAAAEAMRRILIENARKKQRVKHGGELRRVELVDPPHWEDQRMLALDEALNDLAQEDAMAARVVELRFFGGLAHEQVAKTLQITVYVARKKWTYARAWLTEALNPASES